MSKACKRHSDVRIILNEVSIEVGKPEEQLDVFNLAGLWPVNDDLYFSQIHLQALGADQKT
jgi:hypothetical protein